MDSDPDIEFIEKDSGMSSLGGSKDETPERKPVIVSILLTYSVCVNACGAVRTLIGTLCVTAMSGSMGSRKTLSNMNVLSIGLIYRRIALKRKRKSVKL